MTTPASSHSKLPQPWSWAVAGALGISLALCCASGARGEPLSATTVAARAAEHAAKARALESEAYALCCELTSDESAARRQVALMRSTLLLLADHERNTAAGEALKEYYRIGGLQQQSQLLNEAETVLSRLKNAAEIVRDLDIPQNGTSPRAVARQQLQLEDRRVELTGTRELLQISLSRRIGASLAAAEQLELSSQLKLQRSQRQPQPAVEAAWGNRRDLQAISLLCGCLNSDSLPAARTMLGIVQPGLGLSAAVTPTRLLPMLHGGDSANPRCRMGQCSELRESRRRDIEAEVRAAVSLLNTSYRRLALAEEIAQSFKREIEEERGAAEASDTPSPQVDRLTLEWIEARGRYYERLTEARVAEVDLQEAQGLLYPAAR